MNDVTLAVYSQSQFISTEFKELLQSQFFLMPNWKWIVWLIALFLGFLTKPLLQSFIQKFTSLVSHKNETTPFFKIFFKDKIEYSLSWIIITIFWLIVIDSVHFYETISKYSKSLTIILLSINIMRLADHAVDSLGELLIKLTQKSNNQINQQLGPFITKSLKVLIILFGVLIILQNLGVDVTALLAGVGIAGMALAFAAKDTVENVFGSLTIIFDSSFKVGDYVKINDVEGTIEDVGFRSTRIRTTYNSLVTIPNSIVAREKVDNMEKRSKRRLRFFVGLSYDSKSENIQNFNQSLFQYLQNHSNIEPDTVLVRLNNLGDFSINILVRFHILTLDPEFEAKIQEEVNFQILKFADLCQVEIAYPTQKVLLNR